MSGMENSTAGKVITCKAAVAWGPGEPLVMEEILVDPPQKMEVRIKVLFTSICHTDLSAWKGENESQRAYPRIFGHEASGIVESVGEGVRDMKEGDHVIPIFNGECGECLYCKREGTNMCRDYGVNPMKKVMVSDGESRFRTKETRQPIFHFLNTSTFTEFTVVESSCVVKVDPTFPLQKMTLLSCGVSTGVGAAWNTADVKAGSSVAVFGLGAVGLAVAAGARARGASKIIGVDINPAKFAKARALGITECVNPDELETAAHEEITRLTGGGVDYSFECAGSLTALREAFLSTQLGWGLTVLLGVHPGPNMLPLHPMELFAGKQITGSVFGGFKGKTQIPRFAEECMHGAVNLDEFITHELPFEKINEAFQLLKEGKSLRCLMHL
ncbi:alcohol dehydrogenase-like 4 [Rhodamnia argentea]|uniref:alcohol dehydrogenase n=1 Tax=Rhodamnia argentea TaxID=178133 RepID=A0A8B8PZM8_9MYRT|nr:alcohol dehydrogenase-like 4 [Rhodamnia argentea]